MLIDQFRSARRVGTPIVAISTPDQQATVAELASKSAAVESPPMITWDLVRGWRPLSEKGRDAILEALKGADPESATLGPIDSLVQAAGLPERSVLFMLTANRVIDGSPNNIAAVQALANLRDSFKQSMRTVVLLGPSFQLPPEIANDVLVLDEPLPGETELRTIVTEISEAANASMDDVTAARAVDALRGLAAFPAEQALALSASRKGIDLEGLWQRKRDMISATPGLSVWSGGERFADVGGNENVLDFCRKIIAGRDAFRVVVFVDEIEKSLAGATGSVGDSSGVSQGQLQQFLTYMQDREASGMIFVGPPGAGKSAVAKAIGGEAGVPTISLDLGGMKASLVGESESRLRAALKVIDAVGGGRALFVATCNAIATLPPELRRRFTLGTFFFDLPDADERAAIWTIYRRKYGIPESSEIPKESRTWTGAEIKQACLLTYRLGMPLRETPSYIVPVSRSAAEKIAELRRQAHNRFLSASKPGLYEMPNENPELAQASARRAISES